MAFVCHLTAFLKSLLSAWAAAKVSCYPALFGPSFTAIRRASSAAFLPSRNLVAGRVARTQVWALKALAYLRSSRTTSV